MGGDTFGGGLLAKEPGLTVVDRGGRERDMDCAVGEAD